ncbi:MAG TPA: hypothetical protein VFS44_14670 [Gemmatimonadaceae bacterium]|nr:hypothetical protein [Gemmatimonadaceae bacterium]
MQIEHILGASSATAAFQRDVRAYLRGERAERIVAAHPAPRIKVLRVIVHLLERHPELEVDAVRIDARSGCSDFAGMVMVEASNGLRTFDFVWDCAWRARQEGWTDCFGFPDQIRAAREFEWRCFERWEERAGTPDVASPLPRTPAFTDTPTH